MKKSKSNGSFGSVGSLSMIQEAFGDPTKSTEALHALKRINKDINKRLRQAPSDAQYLLGKASSDGLVGQKQNEKKGFAFYLQASKQNHKGATYECAKICEKKKLNQKASQFYRKAASLGEPNSMYRLATALLNGELGLQISNKEAITWLKRAVAADPQNSNALYDLAGCFEVDGNPAVAPDEAYALKLYLKSADLENPKALKKIGFFYEFGKCGCPIDFDNSNSCALAMDLC